MMRIGLCILLVFGRMIMAEESKTNDVQVKYKSQKEINFEQMLIQGQILRPEIGVVTGNEAASLDGLVRLRENFVDRISEDFGEEVQ